MAIDTLNWYPRLTSQSILDWHLNQFLVVTFDQHLINSRSIIDQPLTDSYVLMKIMWDRMWFSVVITLIDDNASSQGLKCCGFRRCSWVSPQQILTIVMMYIVVDKSVQTTLNHIQFDCFLPQHQWQRKCFFQSVCWKRHAWHTDASSVVWTPIDNSKLANQIVRLITIAVKKKVNCRLTVGCAVDRSVVWGVDGMSIKYGSSADWGLIKGIDQGCRSRELIKGVDQRGWSTLDWRCL